jgi:hypothetical protein
VEDGSAEQHHVEDTLKQLLAMDLQLEDSRDRDVVPALCELSVKVVGGGDHAYVTTVRAGQFVTAAATRDLPTRADQIQYATNQGIALATL